MKHCLPKSACNNFDMLRQLQARADDLLERLFVAELEMRRSRTLAKKFAAYRDFGKAVNRIDSLRRDAEELLHGNAKESMLASLDLKVASVMRSSAYRVLEWFHLHANVRWYVIPETVDPLHRLRQC
jgi:hypothetical protein